MSSKPENDRAAGIRPEVLTEAIEVVRGGSQDERVEVSLAVLRDEGLIVASGEYRNGRPEFVATAKGIAVLSALDQQEAARHGYAERS